MIEHTCQERVEFLAYGEMRSENRYVISHCVTLLRRATAKTDGAGAAQAERDDLGRGFGHNYIGIRSDISRVLAIVDNIVDRDDLFGRLANASIIQPCACATDREHIVNALLPPGCRRGDLVSASSHAGLDRNTTLGPMPYL